MKKVLFRFYAHKLVIIILVGVVLTASDSFAAIYKYKGSLINDEFVTSDMYISIDSDQPDYIILMPINQKIYLKSMKSSELSEDGTWDEIYNTNLKRVSIALKKDREKGLYKICIHKKDNIIYFEPKESDNIPVTDTPSLFVNNIMFANIDKKGKIIDDYGTEIIGDQVKFLAPKIIYQTLIPDSLITLNIKLFDPNEKLMTNSYSSNGFSYSVSFITLNIIDIIEQNLGSWKAKFGKGYKMEIYNNTKLIASIDIPTRGILTYIPILARIDASKLGVRGAKVDLPRRNRRQSIYRDLYRRGYIGPFGNDYIITGWRVEEE